VRINISVVGICVQLVIIVHNKHNNMTGSECNALDTGDSWSCYMVSLCDAGRVAFAGRVW